MSPMLRCPLSLRLDRARKLLVPSTSIILPILLAAPHLEADVIFVDDDEPAHFDSIQLAIESAQDGDEIVVGPGIYRGEGDSVVNMLGKAITLRSSDGNLTTTIDCEGERRGISCVTIESEATIIDGFTIRNGSGDSGAGMLVAGSSPTILNCTFEANESDLLGGGVGVIFGEPTFIQCSFVDNASERGGGLHLATWSTVTLEYCKFLRNTAIEGGGIYNNDSTFTLDACSFIENEAVVYGGGVYSFFVQDTEIAGCSFERNSAGYCGGAILQNASTGVIADCRFHRNESQYGSAVQLSSHNSLEIRDCTFTENDAAVSGALCMDTDVGTIIRNCLFVLNTGPNGSAMRFFFNEVHPTLLNTEACHNEDVQVRGSWTDAGGNSIGYACPNYCSTDFNNDLLVDGSDLMYLFGQWSSDDLLADIDGDGTVDGTDLNLVLNDWGSCGGKTIH